jgi:hypothetical protein
LLALDAADPFPRLNDLPGFFPLGLPFAALALVLERAGVVLLLPAIVAPAVTLASAAPFPLPLPLGGAG